jgi:TRAP-type C4-dicarboxylate transport system permease small subunit
MMATTPQTDEHRPLGGRLGRLASTFNAIASHTAHAALWLLTGVVLYDVAVRTIGQPTIWGAELSVYLMLVVAFLGIGHTAAEDGHFRITLVVGRMGRRARLAADCVCTLLALVFAIGFCWGAWKLAAFSFQLGFTTPTVMKLPIGLLQGLIFIGGVTLAIALVLDLLRILRGTPRTEQTTDIWAA